YPATTQQTPAPPPPKYFQVALDIWKFFFLKSLKEYSDKHRALAAQLSGTTLSAVESSVKRSEHLAEPLNAAGLVRLKKQLVEKDCNGLKRTRPAAFNRSEEHTSELQSLTNLVCRLLLEKKKQRRSLR